MKGKFTRRALQSLGLACAITFSLMGQSFAAEDGTSTYLMGTKGPQAGIVPPPGVFSSNLLYIYSADVSSTTELPLDGEFTLGADADLILAVPSTLWVPDISIAGGNLGLFVAVPFGYLDTSVSAVLSGPGGVPILGADLQDDGVSFGDPQAGAMLGWHAGPFHWNVGVTVNLPIGQYKAGELDNISLNRWSVDLNGSATWLDPQTGYELSASAGIIFNGKNSSTNYKTGEEFHLEFAALKHFSPQFAFGLVGYHYQQISGDSGSGAGLGAFKGRVTALGPHINFTVPVGGLPVSVGGRFLTEFGVKNRLEGNAGIVTVGFPLYVAQSPPPAAN